MIGSIKRLAMLLLVLSATTVIVAQTGDSIVQRHDFRFSGQLSGRVSELRLGLQKINFGSAQLFRPLMWFDKMDPRDPLQMTDGVWGALYRYYFRNNGGTSPLQYGQQVVLIRGDTQLLGSVAQLSVYTF